ncbi:MAG: hypothetical protein GF364_05440 [Candidatus Lokiarchaeota archaeon]|nr:hypothetical protein [Candidatus Lokiarchaeota archaeon]
MAKKKKKKKKIKTSRYWTRKCEHCGFEFPNWFVQCPKCKRTWGSSEEEEVVEKPKQTKKVSPAEKELKTVKIITQVAEDEARITSLTLYFSGDNGISWFQMPMKREQDYFLAEIQNVPSQSTIIYYLKGVDENGNEFMEDNDGEFFYYHVVDDMADESELGAPEIAKEAEYDQASTPKEIEEKIAEDIEEEEEEPVQIEGPKFEQPEQYNPLTSGVKFTPLQNIKRDKNLRECPNCKSKIKKDWSACPICGYKL